MSVPSAALTSRRFAALRPVPGSGRQRPSYLHRTLSLLAVLALFQGMAEAIRSHALSNHKVLVLLLALYASLVLLAVLTLTVRRQRALVRVDLAVLLAGFLRFATLFMASVGSHQRPYQDDEGPLVTLAARALVAGGHVYGRHWPQFSQQFGVGTTPLMDGRYADTFSYPPLSALLAAPFVNTLPSWVPVLSLFAFAGLAATALFMFWALPAQLRPAATLICFGMSWYFFYVRNGYPIFLALPLLAVAVHRWTRTGAGGVLGRQGVISAICLGIAASAHQLGWFLAPFLLVGILLARRGELPWRGALLVTGRWAAIAFGSFLLVNLPFMIRDGAAWVSGIGSVLTQHATPQGLGAIDISFYLTSGTGSLAMYSYAAALLLVATLVALLLYPRRLAPALALLPWPAFLLAPRSPETYFVLLVPLWLIAFASCPQEDYQQLWQWRPRLLAHRRFRLVLPALLGVPALLCLLVAVASPVPLKMDISAVQTTAAADGSSTGGSLTGGSLTGGSSTNGSSTAGSPTSSSSVDITGLTVKLTNTSDAVLTPQFASSDNAWLSFGWRVASGPAMLAPGGSGTYELIRRSGSSTRTGAPGSTYLRVFTDNPQTLTSALIPASHS
jgi:uncharacterized membrane protein YhaH (DUF805 family)